MDEKTLLQFIEKIIQGSNELKIQKSLEQLLTILDLNGTEKRLMNIVQEAIAVRKEMSELGKQVESGKKLTKEELDIAIRRGKDRLRREEEARRNSRC